MIIGITGHARHGKDSTADIIVSNFGYRKHALADVMKEACRVIFGWTDAHLYGELKDVVDEEYGVSPRHAFQSLGTEWGQYELSKYDSFNKITGRKLWVKCLLKRIKGDVVICDVRFPHEAEAIKDLGGIIIRVNRPNYDKGFLWFPRFLRNILRYVLWHKSERAVEKVKADYSINNSGTLIDLEITVKAIVFDALRVHVPLPK